MLKLKLYLILKHYLLKWMEPTQRKIWLGYLIITRSRNIKIKQYLPILWIRALISATNINKKEFLAIQVLMIADRATNSLSKS